MKAYDLEVTGSLRVTGSILNSDGTSFLTGSNAGASASLSTRVSTLETSGSITESSASFSTRVTTEEGNVDSLQTDSGSFSTRVNLLEGSGSITESSASFSTRVALLEGSGSITESSASFSTRVTTEEGNVDDLQTDSGSFSTRVTTNEASGALFDGDGSPTFSDLTVTGRITTQQFQTEFVSASITFSSGSNIFGDATDDVHQFTGSIETSGSIILDTLGGNVSGSSSSTGSFGHIKLGTADIGGVHKISLSNNDSGDRNTIFGKLAGAAGLSGGENNVLVGHEAGNDLTGGDENVIIGKSAGDVLTTTSNTILIGKDAGGAINSTDANGTVAIGHSALKALTSGQKNIAIGYEAQQAQTTGDRNTVIGYGAMQAADGGEDFNTVIGSEAGYGINNDASHDNVIIGKNALQGGTGTILGNVAVGTGAMEGVANNSQTGTVAIGSSALNALTTGDANTAIGYETLKVEDVGDYSTAVGYQALTAQAADHSATDAGNTAVGFKAGYAVNTGYYNTLIGRTAGFAITTGAGNIAIGSEAGKALVGGDDNTIIGKQAGLATTAGTNMVIIGKGAGAGIITSDAAGTVALGYEALNDLTSGARNTALGYRVLDVQQAGSDNTGVGYNALGAANHADADHNTAVGVNAGDAITSGYQNTIIGSNADPSASGAIRQIVIGYAVTGQGNNTAVIGDDAMTALYVSSDAGADIHGGRLALGKARTDPTCLIDIRGSTTASTRLLAIGTNSTATTFSVNSAGSAAATYDASGTAVCNIGSAVSGNLEVSLTTRGSCHLAQIAGGEVFVGNTSNRIAESSGGGATITSSGQLIGVVNQGNPLGLNRLTDDGTLVEFRQAGSIEGTISVSGTTVAYNGFSGRHEASGIADNVAVGTVVSTIDELDVHGETGEDRADHPKIEVSDSVGDKRVYGVLAEYDENFNKPMIASVGVGSVKVTGACEGGDLLESNGDGTAKVQSDDIIKSKTIGKVTIGDSNTGVKLVSCVLYCG